MIRQTINCDMCSVEKQAATSYWFVAYEKNGELSLRAWEASMPAKKDAKHLCGQKCVQRLMSNFTASVMSGGHGQEAEFAPAAAVAHTERHRDREREALVAERVHLNAELMAAVEQESWAGPVRAKESLWDVPHKPAKMEREFVHSAASQKAASSRLQKMA